MVFLVAIQMLAALISVVTAGFLLAFRRDRPGNDFLAAFLLALGASLGAFLLVYAGVAFRPGRFELALGMMLGPLLYLHSRSVLRSCAPRRLVVVAHSAPAALAFVESPYLLPAGPGAGSLLVHASMAAYLAFSATEIRDAARAAAPGMASERARRWLRDLLLTVAMLIVADGLCFAAKPFGAPWTYATGSLVFVALLAIAGRAALEGVMNPEIFGWPGISAIYKRELVPAPIATERQPESLVRFLALLDSERLYADPHINLDRLAARAGLSPRVLSRLVNQHLRRSVPDLLNSYRIAEAKRLLSDPDHQRTRILDVLYDTGFNSKSVFNDAFKRATGLAPSEYRRRRLRSRDSLEEERR